MTEVMLKQLKQFVFQNRFSNMPWSCERDEVCIYAQEDEHRERRGR